MADVASDDAFAWLIAPVSPEEFYSTYWQQKPLLVKRGQSDYHAGVFSKEDFDRILRKHDVEYGKFLTITNVVEGVRVNYEPAVGFAQAEVVWPMFQRGCSLRMVHPEQWSDSLWRLLAVLQEHFCSTMGANCYLTPPGSQGFAPHYDDVAVFILQTEGSKRWLLHAPLSERDVLPRFSSADYTPEQVGPPLMEILLEAGDMLYLPRGHIHQAATQSAEHSLHVTISCDQLNTYYDLLAKALPSALALAAEELVELRQSLPRDIYEFMGVVNCDKDDPRRAPFMRRLRELAATALNHLPLDGAVDARAADFLYDSLPPVLTAQEQTAMFTPRDDGMDDSTQLLTADSAIKVVRKYAARLVTEGDTVKLYSSVGNSRLFHGKPQSFLQFDLDVAPALEMILTAYPEFVLVSSLPFDSPEEQVDFAQGLFEENIVMRRV